MADVYGRRRIRAKYHKTKTPKRHYERISRREREENNVLTCPLYLLGAITYEQDKLYQEGGAYYCVLPSFLYDDVKTTSLEDAPKVCTLR